MPTITKPEVNLYVRRMVGSNKYFTKTLLCCDNPPETRTIIKNNSCCGEPRNKQIRSGSTNLSSNYYTTSKQYLQSKCKTYEQNQVVYNRNHETGVGRNDCQSSNNKCSIAVYNPNNKKYNTQGAVTSSERLLRLKYNSIENSYTSTGQRYRGDVGYDNYIVKDSYCKRPFIYRTGGIGQKNICN